MRMRRGIRCLLIGSGLLLCNANVQAAVSLQPETLYQFSSQGSSFDFHVNGLFFTSSDHRLGVEFVDNKGEGPRSIALPAPSSGASMSPGIIYYPDLWPGISLSYEDMHRGAARSTWELDPGANPGQIRLRYDHPVEIEENGALRVRSPSGWIRETAPVAWQLVDGEEHRIEVSFQLYEEASGAMLGFVVDDYDSNRTLFIDPTMKWNSFLGGKGDLYNYGDDGGSAIANDDKGNTYVAGSSESTWGQPIRPYAGGLGDAFVAKIDAQGNLQWNTFLGGASLDYAFDISVDSDGSVYVTGNGNIEGIVPLRPPIGKGDAFVAKLDNNGKLVWVNYLGSSEQDWGSGIYTRDGTILVVGSSEASWGVPRNPYAGDADVFVVELNTLGVLQWNTFIGSSDWDRGSSAAMDDDGNIFVAGSSGDQWGVPVRPFSGGSADGFVAKLDRNGYLLASTFLGSTARDTINDIAVQGKSVIVVGVSGSSWGAPKSPYTGGDSDAFVVHLNQSGELKWISFIGSLHDDCGFSVAVAKAGHIYIAGSSVYIEEDSGEAESKAFAASFDMRGNIRWNTAMGAAGLDLGRGISVDDQAGVFMTGNSQLQWGKPRRVHAGVPGYSDAFVVSLLDEACSFHMIKTNNWGRVVTFCL